MALPAAIVLAFTVVVAAQSGDETTVRAQRPADLDDARVILDDALLVPSPEDALLRAPGASLVHDGGPLAPTRPMVRGLGGARLGVDVVQGNGALSLTDPATGLTDAALLPWAFASAIVVDSGAAGGSAGRLRLSPSIPGGLRARVLAGSLSTVRASVAAASSSERGDVVFGVDAGSTRGDFPFLATSAATPDDGGLLLRTNNDHQRASAFGMAVVRGADVDVRALAFGGAHQGGIPGLATSPTRALRGEDGLLGARVSVERKSTLGTASLALDARGAHRVTFGPDDARQAIESLGGGVSLDLVGLALGPALVDVNSGARTAALMDGRFSRASADARAAARVPLGAFRLSAAADAHAFSDVGVLAGGELRVETGDALRASLAVARTARAPTLDELWAPRGVVLGNPALRPEVFQDVELGVGFVPGRLVEARLVAFAGVIEEGIAYVNRNAYEVAPVNLGAARRAGLDVFASIKPSPIVGVDLAGEVLWSEVEETGAPLPLAPPFVARTALRLGPQDGAHVTAAVRSRGASPSNLFGTLVAAPYTLLDFTARMPVAQNLDLGLALLNALDVLDARDANQLPLPGRLVFLSLEVRG